MVSNLLIMDYVEDRNRLEQDVYLSVTVLFYNCMLNPFTI